MYNRISWANPADLEILNCLQGHSLVLSIGIIARNTGFNKDYTGRRVREMTKRGVLERFEADNGDPAFQLTGLGEAIISRELDPEEIERRTRLPGEE